MAKNEFVLDPALKEYATDRQWELLKAWEIQGTQRAAAKIQGVDDRLISQAWERVKKKAARQGYAPEYDLTKKVPAGLTLSGTSILYNEAGEPTKQWNKTRREGMDPDEAVKLPDPKKITKLSTLTDAEGRVIQQWVSEKPEEAARERAWTEFAKAMAQDIPRVKPLSPLPGHPNQNLAVGYPIGDHHLGMLAWGKETGSADYDMKIGESLLNGAIDYLVQATPSAALGIVAFLGDFLHYDGFEAVTPTSRNVLDSDTRYPKMVRAGVRCMRYLIDRALTKHNEVRVIVEIGNHDLSSSIFLMECLSIAYEMDPRVTVDTSPSHYHYLRFGKVLLGTHHGHGTKMANLPLIMATDRPVDWGATEYRYMWTGHIHQSKVQPATSAQDYSGCVVESFRILAPPDAWAAQKGYRSHQDMKAIVYHKEFGEMARHTVNPKMLNIT